uniref:THAP domain-containing protein 1 n=1 Tax=Esox lucius TaxID=8010 RepID=A0AAY5KM59_ESOLU
MTRCYCSVPFCSNNKQKFPYLSFHDFPVDGKIRARWVRAIRRDEGPSFRILHGSTFVCSQHFPSEDRCTSASGRIRIKQGSVLSRFHWNDWGKGRWTVLNTNPIIYCTIYCTCTTCLNI